MTNELRAEINRANAQKSSGPKTQAGRQRSSMNACKHNLTGTHLILQPDEMEAYNRLTAALISDLKPGNELERQTVQKIIDTHFRLNRIAGIENNMFSFGLIDQTTDSANEDRVEVMVAQTRAWIERSNSFDVLGRYEARLTRQVLKFTLELERLQKDRRHQESIANAKHPNPYEKKPDKFDPASFGSAAPELVMSTNSYRVLTNLPPPMPRVLPAEPEISQTPMQA
jgi:hypothetical protein